MSTATDRLKSVSRSMYLSFAVLPRALREPMGLAYMLCRAADTLADGTSQPVPERREALKQFKSLFQTFPCDLAAAESFCHRFHGVIFTEITQDQGLLNHLTDCFRWLGQCSLTDQTLIGNVVKGVITGMEMDLRVFEEADGPRALATIAELEQYIESIGGEPGRFWSEITLAHRPRIKMSERDQWVRNGIVFGTGLQLVNILRDLPVDLKRGRCYIPEERLQHHSLQLRDLFPPITGDAEKKEAAEKPLPVPAQMEDQFRTIYVDLIELTRGRLLRGLDYLAQIPGREWGLRAAVVWPLLIGLETLRRLRETPTVLNATTRVKVTRGEIYRLLLCTAPMIPSQRWIEQKARSVR